MPDRAIFGRRGLAHDERGVAALEFVLMLPFIWIILILIFNFGQGFLERQRTFVAVREMAIRRGLARDGIDNHTARLKRDTLDRRTMSAEFEMPDGGTCPRQDPIDEDRVSDALNSDLGMSEVSDAVSSIFSFLSMTSVYQVTAQGPPLVGTLLSRRPYKACFALDDQTWTYAETGGLGDMLVNLVKSAFKVFP